jgi:hypothetical protein
MAGVQFLLQYARRFAGRHKKKSIKPLEITIDAVVGHVGFNTVDGPGMAISDQFRAALAVQPFHRCRFPCNRHRS